MSALDDMEEKNEKAAYERGYSDGAAQAREDTAVELEQMETTAKQRYEFATAKNEEVYQQGIIMGLQMATKSLRREVQE